MIDRHTVHALLKAGHPTKEIALQFGVTQRTVQRIAKEPPVEESFSTNRGSRESLKVRTRCGWSPWSFQILRTLSRLKPTTGARVRKLQCVPCPGGGPCCVSRTTSAILSTVISFGRPERGRSRRRPASPSAS